jgi:catechol 2,3-dioxygenase-like lactoylglutathione lyase family enzyme
MARVTGIGGTFLRARDPKALTAWYAKHLGFPLDNWGGVQFLWTDEVPAGTGSTIWSTFPADTPNFGPGTAAGPQQIMINYRVDDLEALLAQLTAAGVAIDSKSDDHTYGHFAWIIDPEGNRLELWQPLIADPPDKP